MTADASDRRDGGFPIPEATRKVLADQWSELEVEATQGRSTWEDLGNASGHPAQTAERLLVRNFALVQSRVTNIVWKIFCSVPKNDRGQGVDV